MAEHSEALIKASLRELAKQLFNGDPTVDELEEKLSALRAENPDAFDVTFIALRGDPRAQKLAFLKMLGASKLATAQA
jgi:hypothetical protein